MSLSLRKLLNIGWLDLEIIEKYYALVDDETVFNELENTPLLEK